MRGALLTLVLLAGCQTADRAFRISPFEGTASPDRVNLWPLAYHNKGETSVLWPLFDVDQRGFALRPLVAKDGSAWSILFPLASFDTKSGDGWVFPFYSFGDNAGLFPVANLGRLSYVGPIWWSEGGGAVRSGGLFPLVRFADTSYVGPFWWRSGGGDTKGGFFPLAAFGKTSYVGPVWWTRDGDSYGFLPLFGVDLFGSGVNHVGPFWWARRGGDDAGIDTGLFPLAWYSGGGRRLGVLPFYLHEIDDTARARYYLLGLGHTYRSPSRNTSWLLPLYFQREVADAADTALVPFFWKRTRGDDADVFTLLGNRSVDPNSKTLNVYPFWWSNEREGSSWRMLLPLFYYERDADERTLLTPLGGRGWSESGETAFVNVLGPLYHSSRSLRRDEERTAFLWPFYERRRVGDERRTRMFGLYSSRESPEAKESFYAFLLGHTHSTESGGSSHRLWPLYSYSSEASPPGPCYWLTIYGRHTTEDVTQTRLFPLWSTERRASSSSWNGLLGLVHHDTWRDEASGELAGSRSWVWPLYSRSRGRDGDPSVLGATTLVGSSSWDTGSSFHVGGPFLWWSQRSETPVVKSSSLRLLTLFLFEDEEFLGRHVPSTEPTRKENRVAYSSSGFLFDAFLSERETYRIWNEEAIDAEGAATLRSYLVRDEDERDPAAVRKVLAPRGYAPAADDHESVLAAIDGFTAANTHEEKQRHVRWPLLYRYERKPGERSWGGPLDLVTYDEDAERERFRLLYFAYRSETRDGKTSRDIFPFITWDTQPDGWRFSFLWRLLHLERSEEGTGGHFLFIPFGSS